MNIKNSNAGLVVIDIFQVLDAHLSKEWPRWSEMSKYQRLVNPESIHDYGLMVNVERALVEIASCN